jgi:hypothetical protein
VDLVYWLGNLYSFEQDFRSKQGQIFRLGNQSSEILAEFLYDLGKANLSLTIDQETLLVQKWKEKSLEDFRLIPETDAGMKEILDAIRGAVNRTYSERLARKAYDVLSRLLISEIQSIRLPGYERKPLSLSKPDQDYIAAVKRIPTIFFSNNSIDDYSLPLRMWVYNHWDHDITFGREEAQIRVYLKNQKDGSLLKEVDLNLFDPNDKERRRKPRLESGETVMAEWNGKWKDGQVRKASWTIMWLPDAEEDSRTFLVYYQ